VETPSVDFNALAAELGAVEATLAGSRPLIEVIRNPRIVCAANAQYAQSQYGFDLDIAAIEAAFPGRATIEKALTRKRLLALLTEQKFDILHLVLPVNPETGELIFSEVNSLTNLPLTANPDAMPASKFSALLPESQTRLVVLATCRALLLAVEVATVANMAASEADITGQQAAEWSECFYGLLAQGRSVHKSFELTRSQIDVPIRAVRQRDVAFANAAA